MKAILDFFLGRDGGPTPGQIHKATRQVTQPHGDAAVRMAAAERLRDWGTPEAVKALLRRFTIQLASTVNDIEECQQVESMLISLGVKAVQPIVSFLEREACVAYPARALEAILSRSEFVTRILSVLEKLEAGFGSHNEQRAGLLRVLEDIEDPRIGEMARRFLGDPNDDVAVAALACIARNADPSYRDDLVRLLVQSRDRPRVRQEAAERLAALGFPTDEHRKEVEAVLPPGFAIDKKGRVVTL